MKFFGGKDPAPSSPDEENEEASPSLGIFARMKQGKQQIKVAVIP